MRFVIIGGGPAGNTAATVAASLGAEVTMIERDIIGGAAHLHDCIPSKAMIATGNALAELSRANTMGLDASGNLDVPALRTRIAGVETTLRDGVTSLEPGAGIYAAAALEGLHTDGVLGKVIESATARWALSDPGKRRNRPPRKTGPLRVGFTFNVKQRRSKEPAATAKD